MKRLRSTLKSAALGSLPRQQSDHVINRDGTQSIRICADGTTFVFEHPDSRGRQYVVRDCGVDEEPLRRLASLVFDLTGWKAMERDAR